MTETIKEILNDPVARARAGSLAQQMEALLIGEQMVCIGHALALLTAGFYLGAPEHARDRLLRSHYCSVKEMVEIGEQVLKEKK